MPPRQMTIAKPKNFSKTLKKMLKDFKKEYVLLVIVIILSILSAVLSILSPLVLQNLLNSASLSNGSSSSALFEVLVNQDGMQYVQINWPFFFSRFGLMFGLYVLSAFLTFLAEFITVSISARFSYDMRERVKAKLDRLPLSYFDKVPYGDTLSIGTNDVDNISRNLQTIIVQTFNSITLFVGTFIAMLVAKWQLALVAIVSLPFTILIVILVSKFSQKQFKSKLIENEEFRKLFMDIYK